MKRKKKAAYAMSTSSSNGGGSPQTDDFLAQNTEYDVEMAILASFFITLFRIERLGKRRVKTHFVSLPIEPNEQISKDAYLTSTHLAGN